MKDVHLYLYLFLTAVGSVVCAGDVNGNFLGGNSDTKKRKKKKKETFSMRRSEPL